MGHYLDLARWNQSLSNYLNQWQVFTLSFLLSLVVFALPVQRRGEWNDPPLPGDGPDYDAIGMGLAAGHGFSSIGSSQEYLAPYLSVADPKQYDYLIRRGTEPSTTAYRPPLLPLLLAGSQKLFGRTFVPIRVMNCVLMSAAGAIAALLVFHIAGIVPAMGMSILFSIFDERTREFARDILTESLAAFFVSLLVWMLIVLARKKQLRMAFITGAVVGLAVLARSAFVLWIPGFILLIVWLSVPTELPWISMNRAKAVIIFLVGFMLVSGPWFARNCIVLNGPMPTGTQGYIGLGSAYSDKIFETHGNWYPLPAEFFSVMKIQEGIQGIELEKQRSLYSKKQATDWIKKNPDRLIRLVLLKANRFWRAKNRFDVVVLVAGILGLILTLHRVEGQVFGCILLFCTLQVVTTYAAYGRFQVPISPVLNALAAIGLWAMMLCATSHRGEVIRWLTVCEDNSIRENTQT